MLKKQHLYVIVLLIVINVFAIYKYYNIMNVINSIDYQVENKHNNILKEHNIIKGNFIKSECFTLCILISDKGCSSCLLNLINTINYQKYIHKYIYYYYVGKSSELLLNIEKTISVQKIIDTKVLLGFDVPIIQPLLLLVDSNNNILMVHEVKINDENVTNNIIMQMSIFLGKRLV